MPILVGLWFWLALIVLVVWIAFLVIEHEDGWWSGVSAVVGVTALWWFTGGHNPLPWLQANMLTVLFAVAAYLFAGVVWAIIEWWMYLHEAADKYAENRQMWQATWDSWSEPRKQETPYKEWIKSKGFPPEITSHKADFSMWLVWWWVCLFWFMTGRAIKKFSNWAYRKLSDMLTRMSQAVFGNRFSELK